MNYKTDYMIVLYLLSDLLLLVEEMTTKLLQDNEAKESENYIQVKSIVMSVACLVHLIENNISTFQSKIDDQKDILNFYKLLTGLSLKKEINDTVKPGDVTFRCTMKTSETEGILIYCLIIACEVTQCNILTNLQRLNLKCIAVTRALGNVFCKLYRKNNYILSNTSFLAGDTNRCETNYTKEIILYNIVYIL